MRIDFSSRNDHACSGSLFDLPTESTLSTWKPKIISLENKFTVRIGPTGGKRGYTPITGKIRTVRSLGDLLWFFFFFLIKQFLAIIFSLQK